MDRSSLHGRKWNSTAIMVGDEPLGMLARDVKTNEKKKGVSPFLSHFFLLFILCSASVFKLFEILKTLVIMLEMK